MTEKDVKIKLRKAVENETPNVLPSVLSQLGDQNVNKSKVITMTKQNNKKLIYSIAAVAAAFAIIVGGVAIANAIKGANDSLISTVTLDVNPSIQIDVNGDQKVLKVLPLNDDGKKVVGEMNFKNSSLDVTVNALIGSMVRNGYINELANSILISVDGANADKLEQKLSKDIEKLLKTDKFDGAVLGQVIDSDDDLDDIAEKYGITEGKAQLIKKIIASNNVYTFEQLAPLTINELNLLAGEKLQNNINCTGVASDGKYIGKGKAEQIALDAAGLKKGEVTALKTEMDYDDGQMLYEVEFKNAGFEYEYDISALDGKVVNFEKDFDDKEEEIIIPDKESFIGLPAAKQAAFKHAGVKGADVYELDAELERKDGVWVYQVEFKYNGYEYEYEINATSGKIIFSEKELID